MSDDWVDMQEHSKRYARAVGSAQASLSFIRILARLEHTTLQEVIAETVKAEAEIERYLRGEAPT